MKTLMAMAVALALTAGAMNAQDVKPAKAEAAKTAKAAVKVGSRKTACTKTAADCPKAKAEECKDKAKAEGMDCCKEAKAAGKECPVCKEKSAAKKTAKKAVKQAEVKKADEKKS